MMRCGLHTKDFKLHSCFCFCFPCAANSQHVMKLFSPRPAFSKRRSVPTLAKPSAILNRPLLVKVEYNPIHYNSLFQTLRVNEQQLQHTVIKPSKTVRVCLYDLLFRWAGVRFGQPDMGREHERGGRGSEEEKKQLLSYFRPDSRRKLSGVVHGRDHKARSLSIDRCPVPSLEGEGRDGGRERASLRNDSSLLAPSPISSSQPGFRLRSPTLCSPPRFRSEEGFSLSGGSDLFPMAGKKLVIILSFLVSVMAFLLFWVSYVS